MQLKQEIQDYIDSQQPAMMQLWREIVEQESWSSDPAGVAAVAARLQQELSGMGLETRLTTFDGAGPSLAANTAPGRLAPVALLAHMDTVHKPGSFGTEKFVIREDGLLHGPGVYDCKGGIVTAILVVRTLLHFGYDARQLRLVFSGDEEVAHGLSHGAGKEVYLRETEGAAAAFNCESGPLNGDVVTRRKGALVMKLHVQGISAHAGANPLAGASAIQEAARLALAIEALNDYDNTYFNVGQITGGTGSNVVPASCDMVISARFTTNAGLEKAIADVQALCAAPADPRVTVTPVVDAIFNAMEPTAKTDALFNTYAAACEALGFDRPQQKYVGGCSDAAYTTMKGIPTLCAVGVRGAENHSPAEYAVPASLAEQAKKLVLTILSLGE